MRDMRDDRDNGDGRDFRDIGAGFFGETVPIVPIVPEKRTENITQKNNPRSFIPKRRLARKNDKGEDRE